jgi:hypothetical protein
VESEDPVAISALWTCPNCGHGFVSANIWHSCTRIDLDAAFAHTTRAVREAFDQFVELIAGCGPVTVIAQKTRIVVMARVRFAGAQVRRDRLIANFALSRRLDDPRFTVEVYNPRWIAHRFVVRTPADLEIDGLDAWLCESYRDLGLQGSLRRQGRPGGTPSETGADHRG